MFLEMQIFAFRDKLRIPPKPSQGTLFQIPDFYTVFYIDFVHINDSQCEYIGQTLLAWNDILFLLDLCLMALSQVYLNLLPRL